ncbi:MAG: hypothetical protein AAB091_06305, partial [Elusimicrobiota bacterium]
MRRIAGWRAWPLAWAWIFPTCALLNAAQTSPKHNRTKLPLDVSLTAVALGGAGLLALGAQDNKIQRHVREFR